ncbi:hypothetical protein IKQ21_04990 [bacterium]|nr:hypothetical protein [bacterium]
MDNILEILKETYLIDNLLSSRELNQEQIIELNTKLNEKFSKSKLKELNETLFKLNKILKDETDKILQNLD